MGLDVSIEDQLHRRERPGADVNSALVRLIALGAPGGLLADVFEWGDTMFNFPQMEKLDLEIQEIEGQDTGTRKDVDLVRGAIRSAMHKRGYIWISGD